MRTRIFSLAVLTAAIAFSAGAQSAVDAYTITPTQLRGTARFVSMGGAFTSLGGDLSCMTQNPAGLGIYRSSDIGLTFDISARKFTAETNAGKYSDSRTPVKFDNFGYVGVSNLKGALRSFQWGVSYNRLAVFDRTTSGYNMPTGNSLTNYIASYTNGTSPDMLLDDASANYDPYFDSRADWLSILAYNSFMINEIPGGNNQYAGLFGQGTTGDALYTVHEHGYTDEYNIDFAGNVSDVFFWGLGVGIVDMEYIAESNYSESMSGATIYDKSTGFTTGNAGFNLYNHRRIGGSGANLKFGVIARPIEALRIGFAVHTPTWLRLNHNGFAQSDYNYTPDNSTDSRPTNSGYAYTPDSDYRSRLNTPWRIMAGASLVIGSKAIVSVDYERVAYNAMTMKEEEVDPRGYLTGHFVDNKYANEDIKNYFRAANIFRAGVEYRINRSFSARIGYNYQDGSVKDDAANGTSEIFTSGTDPSYRFDNSTENICLGLGYRYKSWYIDLAYQHTRQTGTYHAYTDYAGAMGAAPTAKLTATHNNVVISTGFRF